jgi:hypothetical protein
MKARYAPYSLDADVQIYLPNKCNTGDGHIMAMQIGGAMQQHEPHAAVIHLEAGAASYGFLHVNALGKRFKNEDVNTQSKSCDKELEPGGIAWTIYDADGLEQVKQQVDSGLAAVCSTVRCGSPGVWAEYRCRKSHPRTAYQRR